MKTVCLSDVCDLVAGFAFKSQDFGNYENKVIKITNINPPYVDTESLIGVDVSKYDKQKLNKFMTFPGDYVLAMTGATIGKLGRLKKGCAYVNQRVLLFKPVREKVNKDFLFYILSHPIFNKFIFNHLDSETAQPNISATTVGKYEFNLPDLSTQNKIADILVSLDNQISLNTVINNNLEQQAQALFKSWFIDFEPFGGTMPEDWEERPLTDIPCFTLLKPGIKSFDGEKYYVATADADKDGITNKTTFVTMQNKPSRANMQPLVDSVWFAKMKNSRKNILINKLWSEEINKFILSTGFYGFSCGHNTLYYLWCFIASDAFDELKNNLCNGTTMEAINNDGLGQISLNVPPLETIQNFNQQVAPMFEMIAHNKFENEQLAEIRDALLPKLMSGEIDVSKVDVSDPSCLDKSLFNKETE